MLWQKAIGIEPVRVLPIGTVAVGGIDRNDDQRVLGDRVIAERDVLGRDARQHRRRRIEAHRLLDDALGDGELLDVGARDRARPGDGDRFVSHQLLPFWRPRQKIERPCQHLGRCLVPRGEKRQQVVDELLLRHRLAALGMPRREQARQEIVAGLLIFVAAGDEASDRLALLARGAEHAPLPRMPEPFRNAERGIGDRPGAVIEKGPALRAG